MSDANSALEQTPVEQPRTEQAGIHPEHMNYLQTRLAFTQKRIERYSKPGVVQPLDNRLEVARAVLARLQTAREDASRGDVSGIAADLQRQQTENAAYLEKQRQFIEQHPVGSLEGDALYLKLKADIQQGEKVLYKVKDDPDMRGYVQAKIIQDKSLQVTTERGKIMSSVS
jgi:hypothetical protein